MIVDIIEEIVADPAHTFFPHDCLIQYSWQNVRYDCADNKKNYL